LTVPSAPFFNYSYSYFFFFYGEIEKKVVFYAERRESEIRRLEGRKEKKSLDFFFQCCQRSVAVRRPRPGRGTEPIAAAVAGKVRALPAPLFPLRKQLDPPPPPGLILCLSSPAAAFALPGG
jgi:hypothetical protein